MKNKLNDPIIEQPEPITLLLPVIEKNLEIAGIKVSRNEIIKKFYTLTPRIAIITGAVDHPAQIYDDEISKILIKKLWELNAIPLKTTMPAICDGIAQGHYGMRFSLKSRNLSAEFLSNYLIAHHYNGAIIITSCDKTPAAYVAAAIIVDKFYKKYFNKQFYALFINTPEMKDIMVPNFLKGEFNDIFKIIPANLSNERLRCNVYAKYFKFLHSASNLKRVKLKRAEEFLKRLSEFTCPTGGTCPFLGTGSTSKFVLFGLGLVPDKFAFLTPENYKSILNESDEVLKFFLKNIKENKIEYSVSNIVKNNFDNSIRIFGTISGSLNWFLHFEFLSDNLGLNYNRSKILRTMKNVKVYFNYNKSIYDFANSYKSQREFFSFIFHKGIIKDQITVSGFWSKRLNKINKFYTDFILKEPIESPFYEFKSNIFNSVLIKLTPEEKKNMERFHNKLFLTKVYYSEDDCNRDLLNPKNLLLKILKSSTKEKVYRVEKWNKGDIRIAIFILKEGYKADGMPEMYYSTEYINSDLFLRSNTILITDGRFSGATYGFAFGYMQPEAVDSKKLLSLKDGEILHFDFNKRELKLLK
jgi:hypothetical protein